MSGYIGTQPVPQATQTRDSFTATSGQTSFATGGYTPNFLDVYLNGVKLASADYTATNGSDVILASGAATGDILEVVAYTTFTVGSSFTPSIDDNGNATAITIDSSGNVGIGASSPSSQLHLSGSTPIIRLTDTDTNAYGEISSSSSDGNLMFFADQGDTQANTTIRFYVDTTERMRLDSSGNLLVGKTSTGLSVTGTQITSDGRLMVTRDGNQAADFNRKSSDGDIVKFQKDGTTVGSIKARYDYTTLQIGSTGTGITGTSSHKILPSVNNARSDNTNDLGDSSYRWKDLYISGAVYLGGTGSANKLEDYEEGTWTPSSGTGTISSNFARYTKVGNLVTLTGNIYSFSDRSSSNGVAIQGLPFQSSSSSRTAGSVMIRDSDNTTITAAYITSSATQVEFYGVTSGVWDQLKHNDLNNSSAEIYFNITYRTDA
jgi:hypothetical protein